MLCVSGDVTVAPTVTHVSQSEPAVLLTGAADMAFQPRSDAFVFFGATGDLAFKKVFPALQSMIRHGTFDAPIIGVARSGWSLERLRERARASLEAHGGGVDPEAFAKMAKLMRYVDGDYSVRATFDALRRQLDGSQHPLHYLAIPPSMFSVVIRHLGDSVGAQDARLIVEKQFGRCRAYARPRHVTIHAVLSDTPCVLK